MTALAQDQAGVQRLLTLAQAAERLGASISTVRREVRDGRLRSVRVRRLVRIPADELDGYIRARTEAVCRTDKKVRSSGTSVSPHHSGELDAVLARLNRQA